MKRIIVYIIIAFLVYYLLKKHVIDPIKNRDYLKDVGLPDSILKNMSHKELSVTASYLKEFANTKKRYDKTHPFYTILETIKSKYGIFE